MPLGARKDSLYFVLAGCNSTDVREVIAFFQPDKEEFLEYDVASLIHKLGNPKKPIVGAIHGAAVGGGLGLSLVPDFRVACPEEEERQLLNGALSPRDYLVCIPLRCSAIVYRWKYCERPWRPCGAYILVAWSNHRSIDVPEGASE